MYITIEFYDKLLKWVVVQIVKYMIDKKENGWISEELHTSDQSQMICPCGVGR